jgi:uncharacterized protein (TIGR00369 family)
MNKPRKIGLASPAELASRSGQDFLRALVAGELPAPPITETLDFELVEIAAGRVVFTGRPSQKHLNPLGTVHGGYISTLLDSCMGCAVHSLLEPGEGYTTLELKVNFIRPVMPDTGIVRAIGTALHRGRRSGLAEAKLEDSAGKLLAHGSSTCLIFPIVPGAAKDK